MVFLVNKNFLFFSKMYFFETKKSFSSKLLTFDQTKNNWTVDLTLDYGPVIPTIASLLPASGAATGGTLVRIATERTAALPQSAAGVVCVFGDQMVPARLPTRVALDADDAVHVGGKAAKLRIAYECATPRHTLRGNATLEHVAFYLQYNLTGERAGALLGDPQFAFYAPQRISLLQPAAGASIGGTTVRVLGEKFHRRLPNVCRFGNASAIPATFVSAREVRCVTPRGDGTVAFTFLPNGVSPANGTLRFQFEAVADYLYMVLAFTFVIFSVGTAISVRIWLYRRRMRRRRRAALGVADNVGEITFYLFGKGGKEK